MHQLTAVNSTYRTQDRGQGVRSGSTGRRVFSAERHGLGHAAAALPEKGGRSHSNRLSRSPRMRRASIKSRGMMVTRLAWMAARLASLSRSICIAGAANKHGDHEAEPLSCLTYHFS